MSLPQVPGTEHLSDNDRRIYWRYRFAGQALAGLLADPEVDDLYTAGEDAIRAADHMLAKLEGGAK